MTLVERYVEYFVPLVSDFIREIEPLPHPAIERMPQPFLPAFGPRYHSSALKLVIIGQDTLGWGDLREFINGKNELATRLKGGLEYFAEHPFIEWGPSRQKFWGFAMMFLAALHGQRDWSAMKRGELKEILDSFAWGNGNAIELYSSSAAGLGVPAEYWNAILRAGERFNRFHHIFETLHPDVAVVMYRGLDWSTYFEGYHFEEEFRDGRLAHYRLPEAKTDVFHVPHPASMNRIEGPDYFCDKMKEILERHGLVVSFPEFIAGQMEGQKAMAFLSERAPKAEQRIDKYECIAWVADELKKRDTFMSVPALCSLLNEHGYRTNYGEEFNGGRGSYRLVSGAYKRMIMADSPERAHNIAVAFRQPNFEYAYPID